MQQQDGVWARHHRDAQDLPPDEAQAEAGWGIHRGTPQEDQCQGKKNNNDDAHHKKIAVMVR